MKRDFFAGLLVLILVLSLPAACWAQSSPDLSEEERAKLGLPSAQAGDISKVPQPSEQDEEFVASLTPEVYDAVDEYVKTARNLDFKSKGKIHAAKMIGNFYLLWISQPDVFDGGFELIYSVEKKRIVGSFFAGYKG